MSENGWGWATTCAQITRNGLGLLAGLQRRCPASGARRQQHPRMAQVRPARGFSLPGRLKRLISRATRSPGLLHRAITMAPQLPQSIGTPAMLRAASGAGAVVPRPSRAAARPRARSRAPQLRRSGRRTDFLFYACAC